MKGGVSEFLKFMRIKICIFSPFMGASGYLMNGKPSADIILVSLASFFVAIAMYAYNNVKDVREDGINRSRVSPFAKNKTGRAFILFYALLAVLFCIPLTYYAVAFAVMSIAAGSIYSLFRLKKYSLVKNVYTAFVVSMVFLLGAGSSGPMTGEIMIYYVMISLFIFIGSVISDLRDFKGDISSGIKTLPVRIGYEKTKIIVSLFLILYSVILLGFPKLLTLTPFAIIMFFAVNMKKMSFAHSLGSFSFVFLALRLFMR